MKNLIVYYSFTSNNEKVAEYLRNQLSCDIARIETVKKRTGFSILPDLVFNRKPAVKNIRHYLWNYEHVIFIAPIWAGKIATPLKSFLVREKENIKSYSFLTLCGGGNPKQKQNIENQLLSIVDKKPVSHIELWVNDLLNAEKKNTIKNKTGFKIEDGDLAKFESQLRSFIKEENMVNAI
jgi:flavodoxin